MYYNCCNVKKDNPLLTSICIGLLFLLLAIFLYLRGSFVHSPLIVTDEVQYRLVAENLYRYRKFALRGHFPVKAPPLYPFVLFIFKKLFLLTGKRFYQIVNAFLFSSGLIPIYLIAREFKLSRKHSILMSVLGVTIPHSLYIATCMSENLYYPLFLFFVYSVFLFFEKFSLYRAILVGIIWGLAILTKSSATILIIVFIVSCYFIFFYEQFFTAEGKQWTYNKAYHYLILPVISWIVGIFMYSPYLALKLKHLDTSSAALGGYSSELHCAFSKIFSILAIKMILIYSSDMIFASGFITLLPAIVYGIAYPKTKLERHQVFFSFTIIISLVLMASLFSGLLTNWIRERHMFLVLPLILILFFKGIFSIQETFQTKVIIVGWNIALCAISLIFLKLYNFHAASPVMESPWIEILEVYNLFGIPWSHTFNNIGIFILPFIIVLSLFWFVRKNIRIKIFYLWLFIFFFSTANISYFIMHKWSQARLHDQKMQIIKWVEDKIGTNKKLLICGRPAYFEPKKANVDHQLISWNEHFKLGDIFIFRLEMDGLYDIRMISHINDFKKTFFKDIYLLCSNQVKGLKKIAEFSPLNLYKVASLTDITGIHFIYQTNIDIDPRWFFSLTGQCFKNKNGKYVIKSISSGYVVYGPYWRLPIGRYNVKFNLQCPVKSGIRVDIYAGKLGQLAKKDLTCYGEIQPSLKFVVNKDAQYEFRLYLKNGRIIFKGVNIALQ